MIGNPGDRAEAEGLEGEQDGEQERQARSSSSEQPGQVRVLFSSNHTWGATYCHNWAFM